jgi:dethiobiotin synthetase
VTRGVFVTGTDTGVGKTVVSCAILRALRARGVDAIGMKAMETGVGEAGPLDAIALAEAGGHDEPLELVCPQRFALPAAPNVAARHEGRTVDLSCVEEAFATLAARHDFVLVEGAGGLLVPTRDGRDMADLALLLALPVVVVARARLGTINHTLLTLAESARRGLRVAGVVISHGVGRLSEADRSNLDHLRGALGERLVGEVRPLGPDEIPGIDCIRVEALLAD